MEEIGFKKRKMVSVDPEMARVIDEFHRKNFISKGVKMSRTRSTKVLAKMISEKNMIDGSCNFIKKPKRRYKAIKFRI